MTESVFEPLTALVTALTERTDCRICIQDVSGEYAEIINKLPYEYRFHVGPVCMISKSNYLGMGICSRCKYRAVDHAMISDKAFAGACKYGLYEVVQPVYFNGRVSCMIYVGNLLYSEKLFRRRTVRNEIITGIPSDKIYEKIPELCDVQDGDFTPYFRKAEIIRNYIRLLHSESPVETRNPESRISKLVSHVAEYARIYYNEPLTVRLMAKSNYVSENYLGRLFKREMGVSFAEHLNEIRIKKACVLLRDTDDEIIQIAGSVGYGNVTYFNRRFKRLIGTTPMQYRQNQKTAANP